MNWSEYEAMDTFDISTEAEWNALPRDERARKVAYVMSKSIVNSISQYEAGHDGNKPPKKPKK